MRKKGGELTEEQIQNYRQKLKSREYMKVAVNGVALKLLKLGAGNYVDAEFNKTRRRKSMGKKSSAFALNDHLMESIEWLMDRDVKGEELTEQIRRSEAVSKVATVIVNNNNSIVRAHVAKDNSISGRLKLPQMLEDQS